MNLLVKCIGVTLIIIYGAIIDMYDYRMECKRYNNQEATTNHCVAKDIKLLFTNQHFNCRTS